MYHNYLVQLNKHNPYCYNSIVPKMWVNALEKGTLRKPLFKKGSASQKV